MNLTPSQIALFIGSNDQDDGTYCSASTIDESVKRVSKIVLTEDSVKVDEDFLQTGHAQITLDDQPRGLQHFSIDLNRSFNGAFPKDFVVDDYNIRLSDLQMRAKASSVGLSSRLSNIRRRLNQLFEPHKKRYEEHRGLVYKEKSYQNEADLPSHIIKDPRRRVIDDQSPEWLQRYDEQFDKMDNNHILSSLPRELEPIFKGGYNNYRIMLDQRDFVGILPTPTSLLGSTFRGVYVFRRNAPIAIKEYGIQEGDSYINYLTKIAREVGTNLNDIREFARRLDLALFFRRDHRLLTVTQWLPDQARFTTYDQLKQAAADVVENDLSYLCAAINESLLNIDNTFINENIDDLEYDGPEYEAEEFEDFDYIPDDERDEYESQFYEDDEDMDKLSLGSQSQSQNVIKIETGLEDDNGEFRCKRCYVSRPGETAIQALERAVESFYRKKELPSPTQIEIIQSFSEIGPQDQPTKLPAAFVQRGLTYRGFFIETDWDQSTRQWVLA
jgi:hypothetical protein